MPKKKNHKPRAYAWVAYMLTHNPEEMARVRKYGTPSEWLINQAKSPIFMETTDGVYRSITFPLPLSKNAGQKLLFETIIQINLLTTVIPIKTYEIFQHVKTNIKHRRSDTQTNIHMVAEAVCHRAASEFKLEVIFAFDSINTWIAAAYGKTLGYHTIRKALEFLEEQGVLIVREWGTKGNRHRATKIELLQITRDNILTYTSEVDDWTLYSSHAMNAVYKRESVTRQDVLEKAIHHYIDSLVLDEDVTSHVSQLISQNNDSIEGLLFPVRATLVDVIDEVDNDYFDRLLGQLVPTVQEDVTVGGQVSSRIRRSSGFGQGGGGSP